MDCFLGKPYLNLTSINAVRLHLRILYVSDITSSDRKHILQVKSQDQRVETGMKKK